MHEENVDSLEKNALRLRQVFYQSFRDLEGQSSSNNIEKTAAERLMDEASTVIQHHPLVSALVGTLAGVILERTSESIATLVTEQIKNLQSQASLAVHQLAEIKFNDVTRTIVTTGILPLIQMLISKNTLRR